MARKARTALVAALLAAAGATVPSAAAHAASVQPAQVSTTPGSRVFYVDPVRGDDAASGLSLRAPLRSLAQVALLDLRGGDRVRLRAGRTHPGALVAAQSGAAGRPIVVDSYGLGGKPVVQGGECVRVTGDGWRISGILARDCAYAGFSVAGDDVELRGVEATGNVVGIAIEPTAARTVVRASHLHANDQMAPGTPGADDDHGANGVVVSGTDALLTDNVIEGHRAPSADYGHDGAAIEVYGATGTQVSRNVGRDNLAFIELGHAATDGTRVSYNSVSSAHPSAAFLITRGASAYGPVADTVATHNSVRLTGAGSIGISCHPNCTRSILQIGSNVVQAPDAGYAEGPDGTLAPISLGHNVFDDLVDDGWYGIARARTDVRGPALFGLPVGPLGLLGLCAGSPGVDIGGPSWARDIRKAPAPVDGNEDGLAAADAGAVEGPTAECISTR